MSGWCLWVSGMTQVNIKEAFQVLMTLDVKNDIPIHKGNSDLETIVNRLSNVKSRCQV